VELIHAGFTHRGGSGEAEFGSGGVLDRMQACMFLALAADQAWDRGLGELSDDELAGLACAQRRLASRAAAGELAVIGELAARRAGPGGVPGEHMQDEVAALLTLTGRAAARHVAIAEGMTRMPDVAAALAAGQIDVPKASVFTDELMMVDDDLAAAAIAAGVMPDAPGMTTSQLRRELRRQIILFDPEAAARRKEKARQDARVDVWIEPEGTGAIAGRGMDPAATIAAGESLDAAARWLQARSAPGSLDQLRADVLLARLTGRPLYTLLPEPLAGSTAESGIPVGAAAGTGAGGGGHVPGLAGPWPAASGGFATPPGFPQPGFCPPAFPPPGSTGPGFPSPGTSGSTPGWQGLGGTVNLTMPLATFLGTCDAPGEAGGYGTIDAATCRDLAGALATQPAARWCVTVVDRHGRAVGHGCARTGPGPPGSDRAAWLASVTITRIETGTCSHRRESAGYRPSPALRHIVKVRSPRCGYPGCRNRAGRSDDDHTIPYHSGGRSCECNLHPLCRRHHRTKQAPGWGLSQPEPGVLTWSLPCGRHITAVPEPL
jgi:hypothetical protein